MKRVAIVGGGPSGVAAARVLAQEPANLSVHLYEAQQIVGGLWNYNYENKAAVGPQVPSVSPGAGEVPRGPAHVNNGYVSPMYRHLETNIVKQIMKYGDKPFPEPCQAYPTRSEVSQYIQDYAKTIGSNVELRLSTKVEGVEKQAGQWNVSVWDIANDERRVEHYDVVILAHGHFQTPYVPDVPGLSEWNEAVPGAISHAKYYDSSADYRNKKVLIVGNSASGIDLSVQISTVASQVLLSCKDPNESKNDLGPVVEKIGLITKYDVGSNSVTTSDGSVFGDIDYVIFCTGYLFTVPFLNTYREDIETKNGQKLQNLYRHMFYISDPSLILIGLPKLIIPMPFAEQQATYVARVLSGRLSLPSKQDMKKWYDDESAAAGSDRDFLNMAALKDVAYMRELWHLVDAVNDGKGGYVASYWNDDIKKLREDTPALKTRRLVDVIEHARKLREQGKDFELLR